MIRRGSRSRTWRRLAGAALCLTPLSAWAEEPPVPPTEATGEISKPVLTPAIIDDALSIGGTEIEGRKVQSRMTVPVSINGEGPFRFVVDSGADTSVVGNTIAERLQLEPGRRALLTSVTETTVVERVYVDELGVGPTRVRDLELPVLDEGHLGAQGMLGLDALVEQRLMLDFEKRIITLDDARKAPKMGPGVIVVTARLRKGQLILTNARADGHSLDVVIDTGSEVSIGNLALRDKLMRREPEQFQKIAVTGVTGAIAQFDLAVVKNLTIGGVKLQNVVMAFADAPPFDIFDLKAKPAMLLGTDVMEAFRRVSLDFGDRRVRFQLRRCATRSFAMRTSNSRYSSKVSSDAPTNCNR